MPHDALRGIFAFKGMGKENIDNASLVENSPDNRGEEGESLKYQCSVTPQMFIEDLLCSTLCSLSVGCTREGHEKHLLLSRESLTF